MPTGTQSTSYSIEAPQGVEILGPIGAGYEEILTKPALELVADLSRQFDATRRDLLDRREARQKNIDEGELPGFLPNTTQIREGEWTVAPIPADLLDRRVEITGPVDRKMIINALNCGASVFMADFEDANSPTWTNCIDGQINLRDAVRRSISFQNPDGKQYNLNEKTATLLVRPRGWHLLEKHMLVDGQPVSASLFDFGLYFFHNVHAAIERGTAPYFYLPKLESHLEARLWNDVFVFAQERAKVPKGTIRATVLIETIFGAFEMDEILYELRDHSAGLNCGRWDYIFSFIKQFRNRPEFVLPNRAQVTMDRHFLDSYVRLLIKTCHKRNIHAMGGMAAQIPIKSNPQANEAALDKVRQDKLREVKAGHDGTWIAHPGLLPVALEVFNEHMPGPNQIHVKREEVEVTAQDLLKVPKGTITEQGLRLNCDVGIRYLQSWLVGNGCVPIYNLMEDAATAEISRAQVWQWIRHGASLDDGRNITAELVSDVISSELGKMKSEVGEAGYQQGRFELAGKLFEEMSTADEFPEFMTSVAYGYIQ